MSDTKSKPKSKPKAKAKPKPKAEGPRGEIEREEIPTPSLDWMGKSREWPTPVVPGKKGLTLGALNVGTYGEIP
ncbi:MAG: hypothetical protein P8Y95_08260, partial [Gammaproteobacteria bacterium]